MGWCGVVLGFAGAGLIAVAAGGGVRLSGGALLVLGAAAAQATFFVSQKALCAATGASRSPRGRWVSERRWPFRWHPAWPAT
jgi:drug/metabolite transporter (DMT)-like permease